MTREIDDDVYPFTATVFIRARWGSDWYTGSGAIVGRNDVVTAAHVIYDGLLGGLADEIQVYPSYDPDSFNDVFRPVFANYYDDFDIDFDGRLPKGDNNPNSLAGVERDIALLSFNVPLGDRFGWYLIDWNYAGGVAQVSGHPGLYNRQPMLDTGTVFRDPVDVAYRFGSDLEINPGNSGGPVFRMDASGSHVFALVSTTSHAVSLGGHRSWLAPAMVENDSFLPSLPVLSINAASLARNEGTGGITSFSFTITRSHGGADGVSVSWSVTGAGARPASGADFASGAFPFGIVSFARLETSRVISINVEADSIWEPDEQFTVTLSSPMGASLGTATVTATILNDDSFRGGAFSEVIRLANGNDLADAMEGDDTVEGLEGNDTLFGNLGNDSLAAGDGNDSLDGGAGHDMLDGGRGADTLVGGPGDDSLVIESADDLAFETDAGPGGGSDVVHAWGNLRALGAGVENLWMRGAMPLWAIGNAGANVMFGNEAGNVLNGAGGHDTLDGQGGNDTLIGGDGNDVYIITSEGDAIIEAAGAPGGTADLVHAFINISALAPHVENIWVRGSAPLWAIGNAGNNTVLGNDAANTFLGGAGDDSLEGLGGDDTLDGGTGSDSMEGGGGNDIFVLDNPADRATDAAGAADIAQALTNVAMLGAGIEILQQLGWAPLWAIGNAAANVMSGNGANNALNGGAGDDTLDGQGGDDTLLGGEGNDVYVIDSGGDTIAGEAAGGAGGLADIAHAFANIAGLGAHVENLWMRGDAPLWAIGNAGANLMFGNEADNILSGGAGDDTLDGQGGDDTLIGGAGNDIYVVASGGDTITGEAAGAAGGTADIVHAFVNIANLAPHVENVWLRGGAPLWAIGNAGNNTLLGNEAGNAFNGDLGDDRLDGQGARDTLDGGAGADTIEGGEGGDQLRGSAGADFFNLRAASESAGAATDWIEDFAQAEGDRIALTLDGDTTRIGQQDFRFVGERPVFQANNGGEVGFLQDFAFGVTWVYGHTGDGTVDFAFQMRGTVLLRATDFVL